MKEFDEYFLSYSSLKWDGDFTIVKILGQTAKIQKICDVITQNPHDRLI